MMSRKMGIIVFAILFVVLCSVSITPITIIKENYLPINMNLSTDEIIQKELHMNDNYVYKQSGKYLFVFYLSQGSKNGEVKTAIKGTHSGFIFQTYGIKSDLVNYSRNHLDFLKINDKVIGSIYIEHTTGSKYIIHLQLNEKGNYRFTDTINSDFSVLTLPSAANEETIAVIADDLPQNYKISCNIGNQTVDILSAETIKGWVG